MEVGAGASYRGLQHGPNGAGINDMNKLASLAYGGLLQEEKESRTALTGAVSVS